ncbi:MAG: DNA polymerase III subunit delta [Caldimonas manganoxidans]|nr:DNA polymerase III subunit delta [Caldimonas manganoxidans]
MEVRLDRLAAHLRQGLRGLYVLHGDEPLQMQEASDAIRAAARAAGHGERCVYTVVGPHFDWSELLAGAQALSLFSARRLVEIHLPSGKPGKDGSQALQRYAQAVAEGQFGEDVVTLVLLPRMDKTTRASPWFSALEAAGVSVRIDPIERQALPQWIAQRLAAQGQRVAPGEAGQRTLAFFADQVEGNLLAAHQEIQKLGLLYPKGELSFEQVEAAVLNVARYDAFKFTEAVLAGQVARALRMLDGLQAEGNAAVQVHWALAEDIRALQRVKAAVAAGRPLPMALRDNRIWSSAKEKLFERVLPILTDTVLQGLLHAAQICDGLTKGLPHPHWPADPWQALRRLTLMLAESCAGVTRPATPGSTRGLALRPLQDPGP